MDDDTDLYACNLCGQQFTGAARLQRHVRAEHLNNAVEYFEDTSSPSPSTSGGGGGWPCTAPSCGKQLSSRSHLYRHLRNVHGIQPPGVSDGGVLACTYADCDKTFTNRSHLKRHLIQVHKDVVVAERGGPIVSIPAGTGIRTVAPGTKQRIPCTSPGCETTFSSKNHLRRHLKNIHGGLPPGAKKARVAPPPAAPVDEGPGDVTLCFLCCYSFYQKQNHWTTLHRKPHFRQFVEEMHPEGTPNHLNSMSVCPDCLSHVERTMLKRGQVERCQNRVRKLEEQLRRELGILEETLTDYAGEVGAIESVVGGADLTCLEAQLEQMEEGEPEQGLVRGLREGVGQAAGKVQALREQVAEKLRLVENLEPNFMATVEILPDNPDDLEMSPFKRRVYEETLKRNRVRPMPGRRKNAPKFTYIPEEDTFRVGTVDVVLHEDMEALECGDCGFPAGFVDGGVGIMERHVRDSHLIFGDGAGGLGNGEINGEDVGEEGEEGGEDAEPIVESQEDGEGHEDMENAAPNDMVVEEHSLEDPFVNELINNLY